MAKSESRTALVLDLAEEIIVRLRSGERPRIEPYLARYPELAEPLRGLFESMSQLERLAFEHPVPVAPSEVPTPHPSSTIDDLNPELLDNLLNEVDSDSGIGLGSQKTESASFRRPAPFSRLGDFRIIREIGHGGMGIVYEAEQVSLGRQVALKLLPPHMLREERYRQRFEREARSAARLHHTNIVPVFGVGVHEGTPYYVMQYIEGLGLDGVIAEVRRLKSDPFKDSPTVSAEDFSSRPCENMARTLLAGGFDALAAASTKPVDASDPQSNGQPTTDATTTAGDHPPLPEPKPRKDSFGLSSSTASLLAVPASGYARRQAPYKPSYWLGVARIGVQVASALDYAHKQRILHRDIKPSNLLLDVHGTVWLSDFGLAKADDHQNLTHTGDVLGTIRYMPPEAFKGKADERGDIYSLGITLYEMLALQPAFDQRDRGQLISQVTSEEPRRLGKINSEIPKDLETIVHKAIDREPEHRYANAADFAEDLQRFLDDEPIRARPLSTEERLIRWCRHNPVVAALVAMLAVLLFVGVIVATVAAVSFRNMAEKESDARLQGEMTLADMYTFSGIDAGMKGYSGRAVLWFAKAAVQSHRDPEREKLNRLRAELWSRRTPQPVGAFRADVGRPDTMEFDATGRFLVIRNVDMFAKAPDRTTEVKVWDRTTGQFVPLPEELETASIVSLNAGGDQLASESNGTVTVWRFPDLTVVSRLPLRGPILSLAFSPDSPRLAIGDGTRLIRWAYDGSGDPVLIHAHSRPISYLGFNRKGDRLVTVTDASEARVFDATSDSDDRVPLFGPVPAYGYNMSPGELVAPVFADDSGGLLTVTAPGEITWWDTGTRAIARRWRESGAILRIIVGPLGRTFTVCGYRFARIYDVATRKAVGTRMEHRNYVYSAAYRPDEEAIVTVSSDRIARLWSVPNGEPLSHPILHQREALRAAFAPDRLHFATAAEDGLVRIWTMRSDFQDERVIPLPKVEGMLRLSPDGRYVMPQGWNASRRMHDVQIFDIGSTQAAAQPLVHQGVVNAAAFTPDGQRVLTLSSLPEFAEQSRPNAVQLASQTGLVQLWDWRAAMPIGPPLATPSEPMGVDVSPDGTRAAIACAGGQVLLIDPRDMTVISTASHGAAMSIGYLIVKFVQFSADGKAFATWGMGNDTCLWNSESGTLRYRFTHKNWCHDALFSHDSKTLFTASADASVGIWSVETGKIAAPPLAHSDWVFRMALSHDGDSLLTASREGMAMLWDWRHGSQRCPPLENSDEVFGVAFSRDGHWVFTSAKDGTVQSWDRATGKPIGTRWFVQKQAYDLALTPDDAYLLVSGDFGSIRIFPLADYVSGPPSSLPSTTLLTWGELLSSQAVHKGGGIVNLTTDEWLDRWKRFPHEPQSAR